jgi:hypothetical protein
MGPEGLKQVCEALNTLPSSAQVFCGSASASMRSKMVAKNRRPVAIGGIPSRQQVEHR